MEVGMFNHHPQCTSRFVVAQRALCFLSSFKEASMSIRVLRSVGFILSSLSAIVPGLQFFVSGLWISKVSIVGSSKLRLRLLWFWNQPGFVAINDVKSRRDLAQNLAIVSPPSELSEWRTSSFVNPKKQTLFTQSWIPADATSLKALVVILHGLNEHSGRYAYFARQLNAYGYGVFAMDWIGHGGSDGLHGYVESLDYVVSDTKSFVKKVSSEFPGLPLFIFGHSTGGAIALKAASFISDVREVEGLVLTSPAVRVSPVSPFILAIAPIFSFLIPRFQFTGSKVGNAVSRDPLALIAKYSDPLVYTGPIRIRTGTEILRLSSYLLKNLEGISTPFFVLHGSQDKVTDPAGSQELYDRAISQYKKMNLYEGLFHDLLFEPEKDAITQDIVGWMDARLEQRKKPFVI